MEDQHRRPEPDDLSERRYRLLLDMVQAVLRTIGGLQQQIKLILVSEYEQSEELARHTEEINDRLDHIEHELFGAKLPPVSSFGQRSIEAKRRILEQHRLNLDTLRLEEAKRGFDLGIHNQIRETERKIEALIEELIDLQGGLDE